MSENNDAAIFSKEIHHRKITKFQRRKVIVTHVDEIWALDLASMENLASDNNGYKWILCIIDVFSKYVFCVPTKNKTATTILEAFKKVVQDSDRMPSKIWVDQGSEFYNKQFEKWIKDKNITMYSTYGESKSVVVERFIRTLRDKMELYFDETNSREWVDILPKIVDKYNNTKHSTIKMTPVEAIKPENEVPVFNNINKKPKQNKSKKTALFKVGDQVRVSKVKQTFEKGYKANFSYEVYTITEVLQTDPITYQIEDWGGEPIEGSFYTNELLKTKVPDYYEVEKILETRKVGKKKQS